MSKIRGLSLATIVRRCDFRRVSDPGERGWRCISDDKMQFPVCRKELSCVREWQLSTHCGHYRTYSQSRMSITVHYASTRREVWGFYWRLWKRRLWKMHLAIFIAVVAFGSFATFGRLPSDASEFVALTAIAFIPIALFALYPMLMFKPQMRVLTVDDDGITTTIGRHDKSVTWAEIAEVQDSGEAIVIQGRNLNAFIVPTRAFDSRDQRLSFEEFVKAHAQAR